MDMDPSGSGDQPTIPNPIVDPGATAPPVDPAAGPPPPPIPPSAGPVPPDDEPPGKGKGKLIAIVIAMFVVGLLIGGLVIFLAGDKDSKTDTTATTVTSTSTTSSSSTTTSSSSSTTSTKPTSTSSSTTSSAPKPTVPVINNFTVPATVDCTVPLPVPQASVSWNASNATEVDISIDGPGVYQTYPGGSGADALPFSCPGPHTYLLTARGPGGTATKSVTVTKK